MNSVAERGVAFRDWYNRNALMVIGIILATTLASLVIGVIGTFTNARQDAQAQAENKVRDTETARLLECFDDYAAANSTASIEVREASAAKDVATAKAWDALNAEGEAFLAVTQGILEQSVTPKQFKELNDSLARRAKAGRALDHAQAALDDARADNPVPPPPSVFCASDE